MKSYSRLIWLIAVGQGSMGCATHAPTTGEQAPAAACCQSRYPAAAFPTTSTAQLGAEYRRLRRHPCSACARFGGDFHQLLRVLGERLDGQPRPTLERVLGRPDRIRGDSLVYYWRGEHDYLYFRLTAQQRGRSAWYFAYE